MTRTTGASLIGAFLLGVIIGFGVDQVLSVSGRATFTPTYLLPTTLVIVGGAVLAFALPIRSAVRARPARPIEPFRAVRVAVLAKAASLLAAGIGGGSIGLLAFILTRGTAPPVGSVTVIGVSVLASLALLVAALLAESFCTLPKDDDDESAGINPTDAAPDT